MPDDYWVPVRSNGEYVLQAEVSQQHGRGKGGSFRALAPCFPKPKDEGWFLVLGHAQRKELIALKRVGSLRSNSKQHVKSKPATAGRFSPLTSI